MSLAFEEKIREDLRNFLLLSGEIDTKFPRAIDIEEKWIAIGQSYLPDGVCEFRNYPTASLAWMMYIGMAVAQFWEDDWEKYSKKEDLYLYLRDQEGYDTMDEYIRREVLHLTGKAFTDLELLVEECAERTFSALNREQIEPGTADALAAYISCLHQLYLAGMAVQLKRLGYRMVTGN